MDYVIKWNLFLKKATSLYSFEKFFKWFTISKIQKNSLVLLIDLEVF